MTVNILFWNTNNQKLYEQIGEVVFDNQIDIIILVEYGQNDMGLVNHLSKTMTVPFYDNTFSKQFKALKIVSRYNTDFISVIQDNPRYTINEINLADHVFILCICHLPSKAFKPDEHDRSLFLKLFKDDLEKIEKSSNNFQTIIVGDFNYDPYEKTFISMDGLNSTMCKDIAMKVKKTSYKKKFPFFYNPMWSFYGEKGKGKVNGTYYFDSKQNINYYWHMLDQVLIRPEMINKFKEDRLEIIDSTTNFNFLKKEKNGTLIIDTIFSDHLPIKFSLEL